MGLFDWFSKKSSPDVEQLGDALWMANEGKLHGIARLVSEALEAREDVLLVGHFQVTLAKVSKFLNDNGIQCEPRVGRVQTRDLASLFGKDGTPVPAVLSRNLPRPSSGMQVDNADSEGRRIRIIVVERHGLREHDDLIAEFGKHFDGRSSVQFCLSLEDPLLKTFVNNWMRSMMEKMGMEDPNERIQSEMVSRRVEETQNKINKVLRNKDTRHVRANSAEEWFTEFVPNYKELANQ